MVALAATALAVALAVSILSLVPAEAAGEPSPTKTTKEVKYTTAELARIKAWVEAVERHQVKVWVTRYNWNRWMAWALAKERAQQASGRYIDGIEVCNGTTLPTCGIVKRESGFNPRAKNPRSSASGLYQFINGTWRTCGTGYPTAMSAPVRVQVACARKIWANGRGASHWRL